VTNRYLIALLACLPLALPVPASALTLAELTAQVDAETTEITGFRALLTDPDPSRALAAMRAMLLSGDPVLVNLALEAGLSSSNGVMRKIAIENYIAGQPNLVAEAKLVDDGGNASDFANWMRANDYAMSSSTTGYIDISVPPFIKEQNCYGYKDKCYVKVAGDTLSVLLGLDWNSNWGAFELRDGGKLIGSVLTTGGPVELTVDLLGTADQ
jgi:hypothetical protein